MSRITRGRSPSPEVRLGLRENWPQFSLLALDNIFVGGMVGLERTVTPLVGRQEFHLPELTIVTFVVVFGLVKAVTNTLAGIWTTRTTRRAILIVGWLVGLPVPFLLAYGPTWGAVVAANVLLGLNQGLAWSMTVNMKIDLVGPKGRGLALGINETAGYLGVGITALATGYLAAAYGLRPAPELLGAGYAAAGLALAVLVIRDTGAHARLEAAQHRAAADPAADPTTAPAEPDTEQPSTGWIIAQTSWRDRALAVISLAGLTTNFNSGLTWVIWPILFTTHGVAITGVGLIKAVYPLTQGAGMLATGALADLIGRKPPIVAGLFTQAAGLALVAALPTLSAGLAGAFLLGAGTALAYPTLLAAVSDRTHPAWRPTALGVYRFWRDGGYAAGAAVGGIVTALASLTAAGIVAAAFTAGSALLAVRWLTELASGKPPRR